MKKYLVQFEEWLRFRNYTSATIRSYTMSVKNYWLWCEAQQKVDASFDKTNAPQQYLGKRMGRLSFSTVNSDYSAIRLFYEKILKRVWEVAELPRPRTVRKQPPLLSEEQVVQLIESVSNHKHRTVLLLIYATGLRLSEVSGLEISDINGSLGVVHLRQGKGLKDRCIPLPASVLLELRKYYAAYRPEKYLFNGAEPGTPLACRSIQNVFKNALIRTRITVKASVHTLRHCFATHSLRSGADIKSIQYILGHTQLNTTAGYLHLCRHHLSQLPNPAIKLCTPPPLRDTPSAKSCNDTPNPSLPDSSPTE